MPLLLTQSRPFVADHFHDLPGFVEARHGHNWELAATVAADTLQDDAALARGLATWVEQVDYTLLNELPRLAHRNPTAESLAQWAFEHLHTLGLRPLVVKVREKANYWALCRKDPA